ncbi:MAG: M23 family metallopeptidase [Hellea sp.]|nr:M23 family metallopeptidase [Hellea sp.]
MISNLFEESKSAVLRYFPERQIYLRSGGEVSYFVLRTRTQVAATVFAGLVSLWCLVTIFNLAWSYNPLSGNSNDSRTLQAKYERLLDDAEDRYATAQMQLSQQQETFEKAAKNFELKHAAIAELVNQPVLSTDYASMGNADFAKPKVMRAPGVRDQLPRQSRIRAIEKTKVDLGTDLDQPLTNIDDTQNSILLLAEEETLDEIEMTRAIIESTDLNIQDVLNAGAYGTGGPLMNIAAQGASDGRVGEIKARVIEAKILEDALNSVPLGHPVDADHYKSSSFGVRKDPFTKRPAMHEAVDFAAPMGSPIAATADGTVIYSGHKPGYGKVVIVDHGHGFTTKYAHLSKTYVKRGQKVVKGDHIAGMGSTGRSTGSHLHYEVRFQDRVYDPEKFLKAGLYVQ